MICGGEVEVVVGKVAGGPGFEGDVVVHEAFEGDEFAFEFLVGVFAGVGGEQGGVIDGIEIGDVAAGGGFEEGGEVFPLKYGRFGDEYAL